MKKQPEIKKQEDGGQEYNVIKDFVSKTDGQEYRIGSKIILSGTRAVTLKQMGFINESNTVKEL